MKIWSLKYFVLEKIFIIRLMNYESEVQEIYTFQEK